MIIKQLDIRLECIVFLPINRIAPTKTFELSLFMEHNHQKTLKDPVIPNKSY